MKYIIAVLVSTIYSCRNLFRLKIKPKEYLRYFKKSINLTICYTGFLEIQTIKKSFNAGKAGFLCCVYDVVTDWRNFDPTYYLVYKKILSAVAQKEIVDLALNLYVKEKNGLISPDGLERGEDAFKIITAFTKTEEIFIKRTDLSSLGRILQIGDDVLDFEEDIRYGETNCLATPQKYEYLRHFINTMTDKEIKRLFPRGWFLRLVLIKIRKKAEYILNGNK